MVRVQTRAHFRASDAARRLGEAGRDEFRGANLWAGDGFARR